MTSIKTIHLLFLALSNIIAYSQNGTVNVEEVFIQIDINKKLILINKNVEELNELNPDSIYSILSGGREYSLATPITKFEIGTEYNVSDMDNEHYDLYFTQLPIVKINTHNIIVDEPRVYANFVICETDGNYIENGIGIEYRGSWTQTLPKKSLRIEFWQDSLGDETKDYSLLGMRRDDDWNIQAMYNEPLRLRSLLNFELWREIDTIYYAEDQPNAINGVRQKHIELFVNDEYRGLYALSERIDRKQLQLEKYSHNEIKGELYKGVGWGASTYSSLSPFNNQSELWSGLEYEYPDEEINWTNIHGFVDFVVNGDSAAFYDNINTKFIIENAVNYFIFLNLVRATDNTGKNIFIGRYDKDEPYFYIPWDLDGTFGTIWNGTKENITNDILTNGLFKRLMVDTRKSGFLERLQKRWNELRNDVITVENIIGAFHTKFHYLDGNGVYVRELKAWPDSEFFDYNNLEYTQEWLENRIQYLDIVFNDTELLTSIQKEKFAEMARIKIFPNPVSNYIDYEIPESRITADKISIFNLSGQPVSINHLYKHNGRIEISNLTDGTYIIIAEFRNGKRQIGKLVIRKE